MDGIVAVFHVTLQVDKLFFQRQFEMNPARNMDVSAYCHC